MSSTNHKEHIIPVKIYLAIGISLLILTLITVEVSFFNFGPWNLVIAMLIATLKASLVALFFMHLFYDNKLYLSIFVASLVFLGIFITLTMFDTMTRGEVNPVEKSPIRQESVIYDTPAK